MNQLFININHRFSVFINLVSFYTTSTNDSPPLYQSLFSPTVPYPSISNLAASLFNKQFSSSLSFNKQFSSIPKFISFNKTVTMDWRWFRFEVEETLPPFGTNIEKSILEKLTPNERTKQEAINEIIHTEQKHVRNLKIMKHQFYEQIKRTTWNEISSKKSSS